MDSSRLRPPLPLYSLPSLPSLPTLPTFGRPAAHSRPLLQRTADGYAPPIDVPERATEDDAAPLTPDAALGIVRAAMRLATRAYGSMCIVASDADLLAQLHGGRQVAEDATRALRYLSLPLVIGCRELPTGREAYTGVRVQVSASALRRVLSDPALGERIADAVLAVAARMRASSGSARYAASLTARTGEGIRTGRLPNCGQDCALCIGGTAGTARRWDAAGRTLEMERLARLAADGGGLLAALPGRRNGHSRKHAV